MFIELSKTLENFKSLNVMINKTDDNNLCVIVIPETEDKNQAKCIPLKMQGSPEELETHFTEDIRNFTETNQKYHSNLKTIHDEIAAHEKEAREKRKAKLKKKKPNTETKKETKEETNKEEEDNQPDLLSGI